MRVAVGGRTCLRHTRLTSPAPSKWDHDAAFMCRHKAGGLNSAQTKQTINGLSTPNQTLSNPLTLLFHLVTDIKGCKSPRELIMRLRRSGYINRNGRRHQQPWHADPSGRLFHFILHCRDRVKRPCSDTPQFRGGNPYFFSENLYQSIILFADTTESQ